MKKIINFLKEYWIDLFFLCLAIIPVLISYYFDKNEINAESQYYWFQRSGSLMVIFAIALDQEQNKYTSTESSSEITILSNDMHTPVLIGQSLPKIRKYIQRFSIVLMLIGTFIWGYGDLIFK